MQEFSAAYLYLHWSSKGAGLAMWLHVLVARVVGCMSLFAWVDAGCVGCVDFLLWWVQELLFELPWLSIQGSVIMGSVIMVAAVAHRMGRGRVCCMSYLPL